LTLSSKPDGKRLPVMIFLLSSDGDELTYTYDTRATPAGRIASLLADLGTAGIRVP